MNTKGHDDYFPMTKGAFLLLTLVLLFVMFILAIYLWYDLRLAELNLMLDQLK